MSWYGQQTRQHDAKYLKTNKPAESWHSTTELLPLSVFEPANITIPKPSLRRHYPKLRKPDRFPIDRFHHHLVHPRPQHPGLQSKYQLRHSACHTTRPHPVSYTHLTLPTSDLV